MQLWYNVPIDWLRLYYMRYIQGGPIFYQQIVPKCANKASSQYGTYNTECLGGLKS